MLGVPLAMLADRTSRSQRDRRGTRRVERLYRPVRDAASFGQLFLFRLGVGVGEAGGVAPAYALIADYFPPARRARALGDILAWHSAGLLPAVL